MKETSRRHPENPFSATMSGYGTFDGTVFRSTYEPTSQMHAFHQEAHDYFRTMVLDPDFACVAGKSAARRQNYALCAYPDMQDSDVAEGVAYDLMKFKHEFGLKNLSEQQEAFVSFVAVFKEPQITDELKGAEALYTLMHNMHEQDKQKGFGWNASVSNDIRSPEFAYSSGEDAFFITLLHKHSSSPARQSDLTMAIFNGHKVFELLREKDSFERLKLTIRKRQGFIHPSLGDHREVDQFTQYALVTQDEAVQSHHDDVVAKTLGKCPFGHGQ